jgi:hypothetical protein
MPTILAARKAEIQKIEVSGQTKQKKFVRPHFNREELGMVVYVCQPTDCGKLKIGLLPRPPWAKARLYLQNNLHKKSWGMCLKQYSACLAGARP